MGNTLDLIFEIRKSSKSFLLKWENIYVTGEIFLLLLMASNTIISSSVIYMNFCTFFAKNNDLFYHENTQKTFFISNHFNFQGKNMGMAPTVSHPCGLGKTPLLSPSSHP